MNETTSSDKPLSVVRVMVVDDSAVIRGLLTRMLEEEDGIQVVASVGNGQFAVSQLERKLGQIDVIVLDIEMPVMDGLTALPLLIKADPNIKIIMASTLTKKNAEISLKALNGGASEYVAKPSSARDINSTNDFRRELIEKVLSLGHAYQRETKTRGTPMAAPTARRRAPSTPLAPGERAAPKEKLARWEIKKEKDIVLHKEGRSKPDILAIGSSTGGPQALFAFLNGLPKNIGVPIVITQHMPATFTEILASHINRSTGWPCKEAENGDVLKAGEILLAPGDFHMTIVQKGPERVVALTQTEPENFCRPSVDPMLRSVVSIYQSRVFMVMLTGMGNDGANGTKQVIDAGGTVIAQDEKTSVVWGMPGTVASAGYCSAVLPLEKLASHVMAFMARAK